MLGGPLFFLRPLGDDDLQVAEPFLDACSPATATRMEAPHHDGAADLGAGNDQAIDIERMVVLSVGDGAFQRLLHLVRDAALAEGQRVDRALGRHVADHRSDEVQLARADAQVADDALRFGFRQAAWMGRLAHDQPRLAFLSAACPVNVRVGENSPNLWPTMFSFTCTGRNLWPL